MKTKIITFYILLLCSCASTDTMITGSWKSKEPALKNYKSILVASLTGNTVTRNGLESELTELLEKNGLTTAKSIDLFPPTINTQDSSHAILMKKVNARGLEAILTVSLLKKETESHYVDGSYEPMMYAWYPNFWGYYTYWYPYTYSPGYYTETTVYYLETNVYDAKTEKLAWSAQSKTYDLLHEADFSQEFARQIVQKMKQDGIIINLNKDKDEDRYD
ncbi:MAG TPA: hypothetical protein VD905_11730 [Flavobacteriales bacterium]|nr:hypothetical protein [Flavobacteriales bacterium]